MNNTAPKKSLGQHWLRDDHYLESMCEHAQLTADDVVVEVGPGLGTLTAKLSPRVKKIIAVEFDPDLAQELKNHISQNVEIVEADIRSFNFSGVVEGYKVVANIPYYLTSHLVRQLLEATNKPSRIVLLVQKEVAERIVAKPGKLSVLGVASQFFAEVSLGDVVPAEFFDPAPKVDSQIVILEPKAKHPKVQALFFFRVVKAGFGEKRKKLTNSLAGGMHISKDEAKGLLDNLGLPENSRAQELTIDQWVELSRLIDAKISKDA